MEIYSGSSRSLWWNNYLHSPLCSGRTGQKTAWNSAIERSIVSSHAGGSGMPGPAVHHHHHWVLQARLQPHNGYGSTRPCLNLLMTQQTWAAASVEKDGFVQCNQGWNQTRSEEPRRRWMPSCVFDFSKYHRKNGFNRKSVTILPWGHYTRTLDTSRPNWPQHKVYANLVYTLLGGFESGGGGKIKRLMLLQRGLHISGVFYM